MISTLRRPALSPYDALCEQYEPVTAQELSDLLCWPKRRVTYALRALLKDGRVVKMRRGRAEVVWVAL